ncbi:MAG: S41 family peptidase [Planctomycetota bacterium]
MTNEQPPASNLQPRRSSAFRWALLGVLGVAVTGSTFALAQRGDGYSFFEPIVDVQSLVENYYVEDVDAEELQRGAIEGMLEVLDDPYTDYVPPVLADDFNKDLLGEYVGIGASVNTAPGRLQIVSPLEDSPAFHAGVMAGDIVLEIDGQSTEGLSVDECIDLLKGVPGTSVTIRVDRDGEELDIDIERGEIKTLSVKGYHRLDDEDGKWEHMIDRERKIGYIRLVQFTPQCSVEVREALGRLRADRGELGGLVFDLRGNLGGGLDEAIRIVDFFMDEGVIVSTRGRAFPEDITRAGRRGTLPDFPMAVLLDGASASASEIVSGALQENDRAIVVGTRSFGKGSVQTLRPLGRDGLAQFKFTTQRYYLPSGRSIQRTDGSATWGVDPSPGFYVPMTSEERIRAFTVRQEQDVIRSAGARDESQDEWANVTWVLERLEDKQLTAAVTAVQQRIDTGEWIPTGDTPPEGEDLAAEQLVEVQAQRRELLKAIVDLDRRIGRLSVAAAGGETEPEVDLWDNELEIEGGRVTVIGPDGDTIAELDVTGPDLERWLSFADLEKPSAGDGEAPSE